MADSEYHELRERCGEEDIYGRYCMPMTHQTWEQNERHAVICKEHLLSKMRWQGSNINM